MEKVEFVPSAGVTRLTASQMILDLGAAEQL